VVPRRIDGELQLLLIGRRRVATAKEVTELEVRIGIIEVMDKKAYSHILVLGDMDIILIGTVTLEIMSLEVDPVAERLKGPEHTYSKNMQ